MAKQILKPKKEEAMVMKTKAPLGAEDVNAGCQPCEIAPTMRLSPVVGVTSTARYTMQHPTTGLVFVHSRYKGHCSLLASFGSDDPYFPGQRYAYLFGWRNHNNPGGQAVQMRFSKKKSD